MAAATAGKGMASFLHKQHETHLGQGIRPTEGCEAFHRALRLGVEQLLISTREIDEQFERVKLYNIDSLLELEQQKRVAGHTPNHSSTNLSVYARPALVNSYVAPQSEREQIMANIWQGLLGIAPIGIHDNFFDLGGHSLLATKVMSRVREAFHLDLTVRTLFGSPTVAELAQIIEQKQNGKQDKSIQPIHKTERNNFDYILATLDQLSDEEIDSMLYGQEQASAPTEESK